MAAPLCRSRALEAARPIHKSQMKGQRLSGEGAAGFIHPNSSTEQHRAAPGTEGFACRGRPEQRPQCLDAGSCCLEFGAVLGRGALWGSSARCSCAEQPEEEGREAKAGKSPGAAAEPGLFWLCCLRTWHGVCREPRALGRGKDQGSQKTKLLVAQVFLQVSGAGGGCAPRVLSLPQLLSGSAHKGHSEESQNELGP